MSLFSRMIMCKKVHFTRVEADDWHLILNLEKSEADNPIYRPITEFEELKKYFSKSSVYKVLLGGRLVGYCAYELTGKEAEITALFVLERFRQKGLGEIILKKMLEDLRGIKKIKVITSPKNTSALRLYLKYGFVISDWKDNYWKGEPRVFLYKTNLDPDN